MKLFGAWQTAYDDEGDEGDEEDDEDDEDDGWIGESPLHFARCTEYDLNNLA